MSDSHLMSAGNFQPLQSMAAGIDILAPPKKKNKVSQGSGMRILYASADKH